MKKALIYATAAAALAGPATAFAETGWYGSLGASYSTNGSLDVNNDGTLGSLASSDRDLDNDWGGQGAIGYGYGNGWRLEGEYAYHDNDVDLGSGVSAGGAQAQTIMANVLYDFNNGGSIKPYLGVGVGALLLRAAEVGPVGPLQHGFKDDATALGVQGLVGVGFQVNPQLTLDVGYRYLINASNNLSFAAKTGAGYAAPTATYDADYTLGAATVGLRWQFAAPAAAAPPPPPPPPPPAPAPVVETCPTSQFVVYFEFNKSNLTPEASAVLDRAVSDAAKCNYSSVKISGNTDTSGSAQYNEGLSASRAQIVADGLSSRGVNATLISTEALGETKPAVATKDGVKEPLNRRTEVVITFQ